MGSRKRLKSTLVPIAEHRQTKVCDSSMFCEGEGVASQQCISKEGRHLKVLRPLVKLKHAIVELLVSQEAPGGRPGSAYCTMGLVMGPVDFGGYEAVSSILTRDSKHSSSTSTSYHQTRSVR